jgi:hypothetical protein
LQQNVQGDEESQIGVTMKKFLRVLTVLVIAVAIVLAVVLLATLDAMLRESIRGILFN